MFLNINKIINEVIETKNFIPPKEENLNEKIKEIEKERKELKNQRSIEMKNIAKNTFSNVKSGLFGGLTNGIMRGSPEVISSASKYGINGINKGITHLIKK